MKGRITLKFGSLAIMLFWALHAMGMTEVSSSRSEMIPNEKCAATLYVFDGATWFPQDPSGISTTGDDVLISEGTTSLTGVTNVNNLIISEGAVLNIIGVLNLYGNLIIEGDLIFKSTAEGNGELGFVSSSSQIVGDATVERYMMNRRSYRMVSSSVTTSTSIHVNWQEGAVSRTHNPNPGFGTHITGTTMDQTNGFDATQTGNASLFTLNVANQTFVPINNTDVMKLHAGTAYLMYVRGDRSINLDENEGSTETTLRAKGKLVKGTSVQLFNATEEGQYIMFGNPYQSCVSLETVFQGGININPSFYIAYDPTIGDFGSYVAVTLPAGQNMLGSTANKYLQPGHGGQVAVMDAGGAAIAFSEYDKSPGNMTHNSVSGNTAGSNRMFQVQLFTHKNFQLGAGVQDGTGIFFDENYTNEITYQDILKPRNLGENLSFNTGDKKLAIEFREMPQDGEEYILDISGYQHSDYVLSLRLDGIADVSFYLEDTFIGNRIQIEPDGLAYAFNVSEEGSNAPNRFKILVGSKLQNNNSDAISNLQLFPNPITEDHFYFVGSVVSEEGTVAIYDISGRKVLEKNLVFNATQAMVSTDAKLSPGIYFVKLSLPKGEKTFKIIKR